MDDVGFLEQHGATGFSMPATLMVLLPDGSVTHISDINHFKLLDECPLLFHAFEFRESGQVQQANIEATSRTAVVSLLRFLYTGAYLIDQKECSGLLLLHAEVFKIAGDCAYSPSARSKSLHCYTLGFFSCSEDTTPGTSPELYLIGADFVSVPLVDVPELQVQAYANFTRETEFSCCLATPPPDICATIKFLYRYPGDENCEGRHPLLDTLLNYCISVFQYQSLGVREDFRTVVFENPTFHQDLCKTSLRRGFDADGASEIMQLPVCYPIPHSQVLLSKHALGDFQYELWVGGGEPVFGTDGLENEIGFTKKRKPSHGAFTLVHRPKDTDGMVTCVSGESDSESSSEECTLVHRPKKTIGGRRFFSDEREIESFDDQEGYHLIHHPELERGDEPTSSALSTSCDTLNTLVAYHSPPVMEEAKAKDEPNYLSSDSEWDLI